jgi:hypothetical protein
MVAAWWHGQYPEWPVMVAAHDDGPWRKAVAIERGVRAVDADVLVVTDADLVPYGAGEAVAAVLAGAPWAAPMRGIYRLTEAATATLTTPPAVTDLRPWQIERKYAAKLGGGCVVLPAQTWRRVPMDPRFGGWLCEDLSWALALSALAGGPWRGQQSAVHLWHPRAECEDRRIGSAANNALWTRYRCAVTRPLMQALVGEAIEALAVMANPAVPVLP